MNLQEHFNFVIKLGFAITASGQLSIRDQHNSSLWWTLSLDQNNLICLDQDGNIIDGNGTVNFAAQNFHSKIYRKRPDVNAIAHFHPDNAVTWSILQRPFMFTTPESSVFYQNIATASVPGLLAKTESQEVTDALSLNNTLIIYNHGPVTVGKSIESALWRMILLDKICQLNLKALSAGVPQQLDNQTLKRCHKFYARESVMQYQYNNFKNQHGS
jgi:ribulose-5-phosphate 4-epimerase/fuculose-1-phosphate aldolase